MTNSATDEFSPTWSPDGTRIAFARGVDGNHDIFVMPATGGAGTPLTSGGTDDTNPDWSPDNARIVYQSNTSLVVMAADGGNPTPMPLPNGGRRPAWSPDGANIVFDVSPELYSVKPDGSGLVPLTSGGSTTLLSQSPTWQPIPPPAPPGGGGPPPVNLDVDGDAVAAPFDCNDGDPKIHPGAKDKPGDKIDQNCDKRDARFPLLKRSVEAFSATYPSSAYTRFTSMTVKPVRKGDRLRLTCKGPGCELRKKAIKVRKNSRKLKVLRHLKGSKLRKGAVVRLRITRPGTIGRVATWRIRATKVPKTTRKCLRPGAKKPSRCPA